MTPQKQVNTILKQAAQQGVTGVLATSTLAIVNPIGSNPKLGQTQKFFGMRTFGRSVATA